MPNIPGYRANQFRGNVAAMALFAASGDITSLHVEKQRCKRKNKKANKK